MDRGFSKELQWRVPSAYDGEHDDRFYVVRFLFVFRLYGFSPQFTWPSRSELTENLAERREAPIVYKQMRWITLLVKDRSVGRNGHRSSPWRWH